MPLDSRIPLQVQQVQLPDFNALAQQRLANTQNVMAMKAGMQAQQKQEAIKQAYQSSIGPDGQVDYKRLVPAIGQIDPQLGMQVQEHVADIEQKQMTAKKAQLEYGIAQADVAHKDIMLARSATDLAPIIARHLEAGDIKDDEARAILGQATSAPDFSAWQQDFGTRLMDMKDQLAAKHDEMTLGETIRSNKADEGHAAAALAETTRDHAASRALTMRGQNMADARSAQSARKGDMQIVQTENGFFSVDKNTGRAIPIAAGGAGGAQPLVPKGTLDARTKAKFEAAYPKATGALKSATHDLDRQIQDANELMNHPGLSHITGSIGGRTINITPGANNAQALLAKIKAQGGFAALQAMRNNSPTGGALGSVSDAEGKRLENSVAALEQAQSTASFKARLKQYVADLNFAKQNLKGAYQDTYAYKNRGAAPSSGARPSLSSILGQ